MSDTIPTSSATQPNPNPRFYIPTSSYVSPTLPASSRSSLHIDKALHSRLLADHNRYTSTGSFRRRPSARDGGGGLAAALGSYRVSSPINGDDQAGQTGESSNARDIGGNAGGTDPQTPRQMYDPWTRPYASSDPFFRSNSGLRSALDFSSTPPNPIGQAIGVGYTIPPEIIDALVDIHRVLYRGREDQRLGKKEGEEEWVAEIREVRRVVERWFEGDCIYDHPLVRVPSRPSLLNHFILLHLLSDASLPIPTPSNVVHYTNWAIRGIARRMIQGIGLLSPSVEDEVELGRSIKGKGRAIGERRNDQSRKGGTIARGEGRGEKRWKLWEVGAECKEIGGLECYDGYHLGLIEHVITITLLPSLTHRPAPLSHPQAPSHQSSFSSLDLTLQPPAITAQVVPASNTSKSFTGRLAGALVREFEYLLHWDLPISTTVHFNEVGRATHIRDTIDVQDLIETFVPFAKRLSWITRRVTGLMSSTLGHAVIGLASGGKIMLREREYKDPTQEAIGLQQAIAGPSTPRAQTTSDRPPPPPPSNPTTPPRSNAPTVPPPRSGRDNSLGLQGLGVDMGGMAPDRDEPVF